MNPIEWRDWDESAFEDAGRLERPVLLILTASWCRFSRDLMARTFADERVIEEVNQSFIPIHVDKDKRPDIDERFNMGGWPTVAFVDADGEAITGGSNLNPSHSLSCFIDSLSISPASEKSSATKSESSSKKRLPIKGHAKNDGEL